MKQHSSKVSKKKKTSVKKAKLSDKELCDLAKKKSGKIDVCIISPAQVETAAWVRLKCQFGCGGYGQCLVCPPFTPTLEQTRKVLESYNRAILLSFE